MNTFVAWFDALDTGYQWALVLGVVFGLMLLGIGLSLVRPVKDESGWPSPDEWMSDPVAPAPRVRPFAGKRKAAGK